MMAASSANGQRRLDELLDHDDGQPLRCDQLADDLVELVDDDRGQAHGELVEQQDLGIGRQRPGHGEHALLAARQRARQLLAPAGQRGEPLEGRSSTQATLQPGPAERVHEQVLRDRQVREDRSALGDHADAGPGQLLGGVPPQPAARHLDRPGGQGQLTRDRLEQGRLAGAVRAEQRHRRTRPHLEGDPVQHLDAAVPGPHVDGGRGPAAGGDVRPGRLRPSTAALSPARLRDRSRLGRRGGADRVGSPPR